METSLAESQTDSYFPTKWPNGYPKQKDVSDAHKFDCIWISCLYIKIALECHLMHIIYLKFKITFVFYKGIYLQSF